jgi:hypothetical protein
MNPEELISNYDHIIPNDYDGESNAILLCTEEHKNLELVELFHG